MNVPVVIDCDPGHDDAIALLLAAASPELDLLAVTTVAGNTTLDKTTRNALRVLELAGQSRIPVAAGADRPLHGRLTTAEYVHGESGLDGPRLDEPATAPVDGHAVDLLWETIRSSQSPVTVVPMGPLTNIALLMEAHPDVVDNVARIVFMGGAAHIGNVTPGAEFNIYADPEAAARVLAAPTPITMIGLEVTHQALVGSVEADSIRGNGRCATFVSELLDFFASNYPRRFPGGGVPVHDVVAVAHVIDGSLVATERVGVRVDTGEGLSRGRTVVDRYGVTDWEPTIDVGFGVDRDRFVRLLFDRIDSLP